MSQEDSLLPPSPGKSFFPLPRKLRHHRLQETFGPCPAPVAPLLQQVVLVLCPTSGRSRHRRTSTHAPAPQPTEKINKPPRAAASAPGPAPAPPLGSHAAPAAGTSLPPSARSRALPAPHRSLQPRSPRRPAWPAAPGPVSACLLASAPRDPSLAQAHSCPLTQSSPNAQCGRPGSRGSGDGVGG